MGLQMAQRNNLSAAVEEALIAWERWRHQKTILSEWPPASDVYAPIGHAISSLPDFDAVKGRSLFSGDSGVLITADRMALETLRYASSQSEDKANRASDWLIGILQTRDAPGFYYAPVWGMAIDDEIEVTPNLRVVAFDQLPSNFMKDRIVDRATAIWNNTVWKSQLYYDMPATAIVHRLTSVCYIGSPENPYRQILLAQNEIVDRLAILQSTLVGEPLVAGGWFEWEDSKLDFNRFENSMYWHLLEVVPRVIRHIHVDRERIAEISNAAIFKGPWKKDLLRSMHRFVLSQSRRNIPDRALDLVLAFEIAVGGGPGDNAPASWKVSIRAAQLIGGALDTRLETRKTLSTLYQIRSKTAHGGDLKASDATKISLTVTAAEGIYREMLRAALKLSSIPKWESLEMQARS
jgi:hypothetical protein